MLGSWDAAICHLPSATLGPLDPRTLGPFSMLGRCYPPIAVSPLGPLNPRLLEPFSMLGCCYLPFAVSHPRPLGPLNPRTLQYAGKLGCCYLPFAVSHPRTLEPSDPRTLFLILPYPLSHLLLWQFAPSHSAWLFHQKMFVYRSSDRWR